MDSQQTVSSAPDDTAAPGQRRRRPRQACLEGPHPIDLHVGERLRLRRVMLGLSQQALGQLLGVSLQQIQKYEKALNRISASTLYRLADVLDVPVSFFFDDLPDDLSLPPRPHDFSKRESLELLRHYYRIAEASRKRLYELIKVMAQECGEEE